MGIGDSTFDFADALEAAMAAGYAPGELVPGPGAEMPPIGAGFVPQGRTSYQLQGEIARGGMGVILRGRDLELGRDVAIKVLREDLVQRAEVRRRFVEEARIAGQLQHPGIVPVYEFGAMADRRPYFAMKLIEGRTFSELLGKRDRDPAQWHQCLEVFRSVCQTMAYAHSRGVVHRDLKPSNVLIGAFGEVQVVDWGLAKVLRPGAGPGGTDPNGKGGAGAPVRTSGESGGGSASMAGSVMGTPAYMSPEQARGELDALDERSDVFSLGAILCEMLTGAPPYDDTRSKVGSSTVELAAGAQLEPAFARIDSSDADQELRELCRSCLSASPSDRPRSAAEVAERIDEFLAAVESRGRTAEVREAAAKVRARATLGVSAAALLLALAGAGAWLRLKEQRSRRTADLDRHVGASLEEAALARGRQDWPSALAALESARARIESGDASAGVRAQVESLDATIRAEADAARAAKELADDTSRLLARLQDMRRPEGDANYPTDWSALDRRYGEILASHGLDLDAGEVEAVARSLATRGREVELASALDEWISTRHHAGNEPGAARLAEVANALDGDYQRSILRRALATDDLEALRALAERPESTSLAAPTVRLLGHALAQGDRHEDAIRILLDARRRFPADVALAVELARALRDVKPVRGAEAAAHYEAALALRPDSVEIWHELGDTFVRDLQRFEEGLDVFRRALEGHPEDGHLAFHVAFALTMLGRHEEAIPAYHRSIELDPAHSRTYLNLGYSLDVLGRTEEALEEFRRSVEVDPGLAVGHHNVASALRKLERYDEALEHELRAIELDPGAALAYVNLGYCYFRLRRFEEAVDAYARARELDPANGSTAYWHGVALESLGRVHEAVAANRDAVRLAPNDPFARSSLAMTLVIDEPGEAEAKEAVEHALQATILGPRDPSNFAILGIALYVAGRTEEAVTALERSEELGTPEPVLNGLFLVLCHARAGRASEARALYERVEPGLAGLVRNSPGMARFVEEARAKLGVSR